MCRLFGLVANKPVDVHFSFNQAEKSLVSQSAANPDGWGIGWYDDGGTANVFKECIRARDSGELPTKIREIKSRLIVAHVRKGTQGKPTYNNTHPFQDGKWIFAHNGSITTYSEMRKMLSSKFKEKVRGETDSEVYFYWLLQKIEEEGDVLEGIKEAVSEIVEHHQYSGLNFLLSEGSNLYAFRYGSCSPQRYSMFYLQRPPDSPLNYVSPVTKQLIELIEHKVHENEEAVLIASEKLTTGENWQEISWGALAIIKPSLHIEIRHIS